MLKKLYKHEFYSLFRTLLPIYAALIGFAALSRLTFLFNTNNRILSIVGGFASTIYVFSIIAMFVVGIVIVVMRFYKNLLSHEGYLTFTLPFSATQHIVCKMICGIAVTVVNMFAMIISFLILGAGTETLNSVFKAIPEFFEIVSSEVSSGNIAILIIEILLMFIVSMVSGLLMFYAAMAIGQQFKNKIGGAVISYICMYAVLQVITTIIMIPTTFANADKVEAYMISGVNAVQTFLLIMIIWSAILSVVYFFITRHFLSKKLNLE